MTKATDRRKGLFGIYSFRGLESVSMVPGSMPAGRQVCMALEQSLRAYILFFF